MNNLYRICLITFQHTVNQVPQRTPEVFPARQIVLVNKEYVVLEASVEVRF